MCEVVYNHENIAIRAEGADIWVVDLSALGPDFDCKDSTLIQHMGRREYQVIRTEKDHSTESSVGEGIREKQSSVL